MRADAATLLLVGPRERTPATKMTAGKATAPISGAAGIQLTSALVRSGNQVDAVAAVSGDTVNAVPYGVLETLDPSTTPYGSLVVSVQAGTSTVSRSR